ncbi:hypothetical protein [Flavobacterium taihuense]|uniref:Uncharacterized protein n=1 Tax=Flavobacterium taihuense TaxID=2857508 RepID=A0ABS6Y418_9FLAO|nr:hypothetical protein [Flavobacterium taihuense]MBW4362823.1 hypothetical protein [Flavobacterium taihuense]
MYSKLKAEKLIIEFDYLKNKSYFPFGPEGREFKITDLKITEPQISYVESLILKKRHPGDSENKLTEEKEKSIEWKVTIIITDKTDTLEVELEESLKVLKIRHDISKMFN